jgi:hypothetical protein
MQRVAIAIAASDVEKKPLSDENSNNVSQHTCIMRFSLSQNSLKEQLPREEN